MRTKRNLFIPIILAVLILLCGTDCAGILKDGLKMDAAGAKARYNDEALVSWQKVPSADGYEIWRGAKRIGKLSASAASKAGYEYRDSRLRTGKRYRYKVRAYRDILGVRLHGAAPASAAITAKARRPEIVMVDSRDSDNYGLPRELKKAGCNVTIVYRLKDVDVTKFDALVVPGGWDVDPSLWGEKPHPSVDELTPKLDRFQIAAIQQFVKAEKPILGICRGEQLINVALGGTMIQNLYPEKKSPKYEKGYHVVKNLKGSWVYNIYGPEPKVYFFHHQAVGKLGRGIIATSWSTDHKHRHVEAIQHRTLPIYGVQWHPDAYVKEQGNAIFHAFAKECLKSMNEKEDN